MTRTRTATVEGHTYEIPEMWICGATRFNSLRTALQIWHEQASLASLVAHAAHDRSGWQRKGVSHVAR